MVGIIADVYIEPNERYEAVEAYKDRLSETQIETILEAPEGALIRIQMDGQRAQVQIIEEG
jgi:hypothetical protein